MVDYEKEFNKLIAIERHLVDASNQLRTAERLLDGGLLHDNVCQTLETLEEALALTLKAKKVMLNEWKQSMAPASVA